MKAWELEAHEQIRDLVASYNVLGDKGKFDEVMDLFAQEAVMDVGDGLIYTGVEQIRTIFTKTRDSITASQVDKPSPLFLQHHTATLAIKVNGSDLSNGRADGQAYFTVMSSGGVDHWGRYQDSYRPVDGLWRFTARRVRVDGVTPGGWADLRLRSSSEL
ncbi:MAG: nuclear transport factor 2 family protein [Acidimicrobiales bacterium]|nr:nuclear transport factor 2 family protein [Acidimicrobiales bacterium]